MKLCIIMRGLPGSGRNEVASELSTSLKLAELSPEQYFKIRNEPYDYKRLKEAYAAQWEVFKDLIKQSIDVLVNASNIKEYHYRSYRDYATRNGYQVVIAGIPHKDPKKCAENAKMPERIIRQMMLDWEL